MVGSTTLPRVLPTILSAATSATEDVWPGANHPWSAQPIRWVVRGGRQSLQAKTKLSRGTPWRLAMAADNFLPARPPLTCRTAL